MNSRVIHLILNSSKRDLKAMTCPGPFILVRTHPKYGLCITAGCITGPIGPASLMSYWSYWSSQSYVHQSNLFIVSSLRITTLVLLVKLVMCAVQHWSPFVPVSDTPYFTFLTYVHQTWSCQSQVPTGHTSHCKTF